MEQKNAQTRDELFASDRGEREYYQSRSQTKSAFKQNTKLPLTLDGCHTILEIVSEALEIPLDETSTQVFCGYVHHLPQTQNWFSFDEIGKVLYKNMANGVTWKLDQEAKEKAAEKKARLDEKAKLTLAGDTDAQSANGESTTTPVQ